LHVRVGTYAGERMTSEASDWAKVVVAVVDSGWNRQVASPRVLTGLGLVDPSDGLKFLLSEDDHDRNGHGTRCSQTILNAAPAALILPIRVFGRRLESSIQHICAALRIAADRGARVASLSLATVESSSIVPLYSACQAAVSSGVIIVAAADMSSGGGFPSTFDNVIGVASADFDGPGEYRFTPDRPVEIIARRTFRAETAPRRWGLRSNSIAAARIAGLIATFLSTRPQAKLDGVRAWLNDPHNQLGSQQEPDREAVHR